MSAVTSVVIANALVILYIVFAFRDDELGDARGLARKAD
jgi:hypothetical protein